MLQQRRGEKETPDTAKQGENLQQNTDISINNEEIVIEDIGSKLERIGRAERKREVFRTRREIKRLVRDLVDKAALVAEVIRAVIQEVIVKTVTEVETIKPIVEEVLRDTEKKVRVRKAKRLEKGYKERILPMEVVDEALETKLSKERVKRLEIIEKRRKEERRMEVDTLEEDREPEYRKNRRKNIMEYYSDRFRFLYPEE